MHLRERFLNRLKKEDSYFASCYYSLFKLLNPKDLEEILSYHCSIFLGQDSHFGEYGKENWFAIFHKMFRQTDVFSDCYRTTHVKLLTPEEESEYKYLRNKVRGEHYSKLPELGDETKLFNDEYSKYLDLMGKVKRQDHNESITGTLDVLVYNLIHMDEKNVLYVTLQGLFEDVEDGHFTKNDDELKRI